MSEKLLGTRSTAGYEARLESQDASAATRRIAARLLQRFPGRSYYAVAVRRVERPFREVQLAAYYHYLDRCSMGAATDNPAKMDADFTVGAAELADEVLAFALVDVQNDRAIVRSLWVEDSDQCAIARQLAQALAALRDQLGVRSVACLQPPGDFGYSLKQAGFVKYSAEGMDIYVR